MNKAILIGRLCADPTTRQTQAGKTVASYRLAVDRPPNKDGQKEADFLNIVAFGSNGDFAAKYLQKGTKIAIEGRIQARSYDDKDGKKVYVTEIIVDRQEFCESKQASASSSYTAPAPERQPNIQVSAPANDDFCVMDDGEDLPFD